MKEKSLKQHCFLVSMDFDLLFLANPKGKTTKNLLLRSLAALKQATVVELHHFIKKEFSRTVSYQAVRQALMEMTDEGIVLKEEKQYRLRKTWIADLKETINLLENSQEKQSIRILDKQTTQISLKNLDELGNFILVGLEQQYFDLSKAEPIHLHVNHLWIPFSDPNKRERLKKVFRKNKVSVTTEQKSVGDRLLKRWYQQFGPVHLGKKREAPCEYIVHADCVVQMFFPEELVKTMDDVYSFKVKSDFLQKISDMTFKEYGIEIIITRNASVAEKIRKELRSML